MSDGTLRFDTKLDSKQIDQDIKEIKVKLKEVQKDIAKTEKELNGKREAVKTVKYTVDKTQLESEIASLERTLGAQMASLAETQTALTDNQAWKAQATEIDKVSLALEKLLNKREKLDALGTDPQSKAYRSLQIEIEKTRQKLAELQGEQYKAKKPAMDLKTALVGIAKSAKNAGNSVKENLGNKLSSATNKAASSVLKLSGMLKLMAIRMAMRAVLASLIDGFKNLAQASPEVNSNLSVIMTSLSQLKNSFAAAFAPILSIVTPVITQIIDLLSACMTQVARFMAMLAGKSSFTKATKVQQDFAKSLNGVAGSAKKAGLSLASFDEINNLDTSSSDESSGSPGTSPKDMFKEEEIATGQSELVDRIKALWADIIQVGANVGKAFKEAWDYAGNGEAIMKSLNNMGDSFYNTLKRITEATVKWSDNLDLRPLLTSVRGLIESLEPIVQTLGDVFAWIYEEVVLPLASWAIEGVLPAFLDILSGALNVLQSVLTVIQPLWDWLWTNLLQPLAEWTGGVVVSILEGIAVVLQSISTWISDNQALLENLIIIVGSIAAAWGLFNIAITAYNIAMTAYNIICGLGTAATTLFGIAMQFLTSPITLIILAIGALIAVVILMIKYWDDIKEAAIDAWNKIKTMWNSAWTWFKSTVVDPIANGFNTMIENIKSWFSSAWQWVQDVWSGVSKWFEDTVLNPVKEGFKNALNGIIDFIEGMVNFGISGIESLVNGVINGLNGMISAFNFASRIFGFTLDPISPFAMERIKIPRLATGTVVPARAGEFAAILGDNNRETEVVSPLSTIKGALLEALAEAGGLNQGNSGQLDSIIDLLQQLLRKDGNVYLMDQIVGIIGDALDEIKARKGTPVFSGMNR